jgi:hypothetical protein
MVLVQAGLIEIADYNDLALEVNRLFSDNTVSLVWSTSDLILNDVAGSSGETPGATRDLVPSPLSTEFIVVVVDDVTLAVTTDYTVSYLNPVVITFIASLAPSAVLQVFNRHTHRFGWGQQASVHPITAGDPVLADEATLQAYLEANVNNLIDKTNIMEARITGPSSLTRLAQGALIYAADKVLISTTISTDVISGSNYWKNDIATTAGSVQTFQRTADWDTKLVGTMRYTWDNYDDLRHFFNSGGQVRANLVMTGDSSNQAFNNWNQVTTDMGSLILDYDTTSQSGIDGTSDNLGAYELTTIYQDIFRSGSPIAPVDDNGDFDGYGTYNDLVIIWAARLQEDTPNAGDISIDLRATMDDKSLNTTAEGTTTYNGGYKLADNQTDNSAIFSVTTDNPTLTVFNTFVSGDDS